MNAESLTQRMELSYVSLIPPFGKGGLGGICYISKNQLESTDNNNRENIMVYYQERLKPFSRKLRKKQTIEELMLWKNLRRKQILGIQFYRQRPIGKYIVDFYAPTVRLVIEIDGIQHYTKNNMKYDEERDNYLKHIGLEVLRFNNIEVSRCLDIVIHVIERKIQGKPITIEHGTLIELC
ncbi:MAG: endonuclease domain-containing protein [Gammaproteobacteria bacterium]